MTLENDTSDRPSRLDDPQFHDSTTVMEKGGITTEVLTSEVSYYRRLGYTVVEPGQPSGPTSYIDKNKVRAFNSIKRFFWTDPD